VALATSRWARCAGAVALVGLLRTVWIHTGSEGLAGLVHPEPAIDVRFRALRALLPERGLVGYFSDAPGEDKRNYYRAAYALAPLVLRRGDLEREWVVAELRDPAQVAQLARAEGLTLVLQGDGVALLRRTAGAAK
jgi:hypothetical protein